MALSISQMRPGPAAPRSIKQLSRDANEYEYDAQVPLKYYLRSAAAMTKQAGIYMQEGDDEMTYLLLFRHANLVLSDLKNHPEAKVHATELKNLMSEVRKNLKALELLKPKIERRYEEYTQFMNVREERRQAEAARRRIPDDGSVQDYGPGLSQRRIERLHGQKHTDIAARLAGQEFSRRGPGRRSYPTGLAQPSDKEDLARRMQEIRLRMERNANEPLGPDAEQRRAYVESSTGYSYPTVPVTQKALQRPLELLTPRSSSLTDTVQAPLLPPKPGQSTLSNAPPRPEKQVAPTIATTTHEEPAYTFAPGAQLETGTPLRTVFLPPTLRTTFLRLAHQNTLRNLETCGFLAGTLRANALFISALVLPGQTATSDTCEMTDESELFDYVDQHELMILGWIHTHPTQTCFMSSRDLHTHSGYQMMLAESIAIVCAPSKGDTIHGGDWGVYRLTDPPGKMAILQCDKPGIFHPHDVDNIYTDAMRPGHVMEISGMDFEIVDLRHNGENSKQ